LVLSQYIVVAGAGGVGSCVVAMLRSAGHAVIATVLNDEEERAVKAKDPDVESLRLDLSDADSVLAALRQRIEALDRLDGIGVCGAIAPLGPLEMTPLSLARRTFEINVLSDLAIYQAALPALRKSGGRLAMVSSMAGKASMPFVGAYSASKFALEGLADAMRREVIAQGVSVSLVLPGGIKTPMVVNQLREVAAAIERLTAEEDALYGVLYRGFQTAASQSHTGDAAEPEVVAEAVVAALTAPDPKPRYVVGEDARQLIAAADAMSDEEADAMFTQMFAG
jgi:NAD(P)-dependent dehydrogenase (short-subunit alcohol dehydrogenase family)